MQKYEFAYIVVVIEYFFFKYCILTLGVNKKFKSMNFIYSLSLQYDINTVRFIKPYQDPVYKCTNSRQGFMKWAILKKIIRRFLCICLLTQKGYT